MFWRNAKTVCFLLLVFSTGCASVPSPPQVRIPSFLKRKEAPVSEEKTKVREADDQESTPKRQPLIALNRSNSSRKRHDPETQRMIAEELVDATPSERAEWNDFLASIEPSMIPYVLESRRVNREKRPPNSNREPGFGSDAMLAQNRVPHSLPNPSTKTADHSQVQGQKGANSIELASSEENVVAVEDVIRPDNSSFQSNETDWSGKLKSLTEWEKNPLNFARNDSNEAAPEKPRHLPKIITNPFQRQGGQPIEIGTSSASSLGGAEDQQVKVNTPDSLRISPGAKLWEEELNKLVSLMEAEASASGVTGSGTLSRDELRKQVALRMLYLVNDQAELAMQPIPGLQAADQEFWISLFWGLSSYLNENGLDPTERSTKTIEQLRSATHYLQMASNLQLRNVSFCSKINGFGNYEQFISDEFAPGQPVLIYCDIRNFQSESSDDGFYITKLRSSLEIYEGGQDGRMVERSPFPATEDRCRSVRSDYYHSYRIDLPQNLSVGQHLLKLTVYDELSGKSATEYLRFTVQ